MDKGPRDAAGLFLPCGECADAAIPAVGHRAVRCGLLRALHGDKAKPRMRFLDARTCNAPYLRVRTRVNAQRRFTDLEHCKLDHERYRSFLKKSFANSLKRQGAINKVHNKEGERWCKTDNYSNTGKIIVVNYLQMFRENSAEALVLGRRGSFGRLRVLVQKVRRTGR